MINSPLIQIRGLSRLPISQEYSHTKPSHPNCPTEEESMFLPKQMMANINIETLSEEPLAAIFEMNTPLQKQAPTKGRTGKG